jgi:hypothetical protein
MTVDPTQSYKDYAARLDENLWDLYKADEERASERW